MNFKYYILSALLFPLALFPILVFAGGGEQALPLFSSINWEEIVGHIIKFIIVAIILNCFQLLYSQQCFQFGGNMEETQK